MSNLTPLWILALGAGGALAVALAEQVVAGARPAPLALVRGAAATLREPLSRPDVRDGWLFHMAPGLLLLAAVAALAFVPWTPGLRGIDISVGVTAFAAALAYVTPAIFMAGWGAGRPLAVVGGFRFIALMLAYAMPVAMVTTAVAAPAGSLRPVDIVTAQDSLPFALVQPLGLVLWLPSVLAVCFAPPFDVPQAGGELGGGAFSEYRGLDAALIRLAQRILLVAVSGMTAALFLAGWLGPWLPAGAWMALKTGAVAVGLLWAGRRLARVEVDRILSLAWKVAIPLAILAIMISGLVTLLFYR